MERLHRYERDKYWRYVRDHVEENHWIYVRFKGERPIQKDATTRFFPAIRVDE